MIYLFGIKDQVSVIMHERFLTKEQQAKATLVLETLPEPEERDGYCAVRYIDKDTNEFSYIYREIEDEVPEDYVEEVSKKLEESVGQQNA